MENSASSSLQSLQVLENENGTNSLNFAILDRLEAYRQPVDGKLELLLCWPDTELAPQHWRQKSNPYLHSGAVKGYEAISCPHSTQNWGGLQSGHGLAVLKGSTDGCWYYAVGSYQDWNGGIPGPSHAVQKVELYTRRDINKNWHLIMRQTAPQYWTKNGLLQLVGTVDNTNYNALDRLETYRQPVDGKLELLLCWPDTELAPQHWRQKSNPYLHSGAVDGYEAISCPHSANAWGGLQSGHANAVLKGSTDGCWFYAVGSYQEWGGGIPGPNDAVQQVELRTRHSEKDQWVLIMRQTTPHPYWTKTKV